MEIWKYIKGFEGLYEVSNYGRVRSLDVVLERRGFPYRKKGRILKISDNGNGYKKVNLWSDIGQSQVYVHRIVAEIFVGNPDNYTQVDHIDRDKSNNHYSNLRWISASDNINNNANRSRYSANRKGHKHYDEKVKVEVASLYSSGMKVMDISRKLGIPRQTVSDFKNYKKES